MMLLGSWYVDVGSSRRVNDVTDRRTDGFSALYIYIDYMIKVIIEYNISIL